MPSTIVRSSAKTGLVLLSSNASVASDGLVTVSARFLAPAAGLTPGVFDLDAAWPSGFELPPGTPSLQGGPYLLSRNITKENGLTFIDAEYVSATSPVRIALSEATEKLNFSGYAEQSATSQLGTASASGSLAFDYYTRSQTATYTLIAPAFFDYKPSGSIGRRFNIKKEGFSSLVTTTETETLSSSRETLGKVTRISVTARRVIEQGNAPAIQFSPFSGATINGVAMSNPWASNRFA